MNQNKIIPVLIANSALEQNKPMAFARLRKDRNYYKKIMQGAIKNGEKVNVYMQVTKTIIAETRTYTVDVQYNPETKNYYCYLPDGQKIIFC